MDKRAYLYNNLSAWEKKKEMYPIHKRLLPFIYNGIACKDVNDVLLQENFSAGENVLDVGCGVGNTIITLTKSKNIQGFGISISNEEVIIAKQHALSNGVEETCVFFNQSFDHALAFHFDKAIAVESLKHSFDINATACNLYAHCNSGGSIYVIDDFYNADNNIGDKEKQLMKDWELEYLYSREDFVNAFVNAGFVQQASTDFSAHIIPKSKMLLQLKINLFSLLKIINKQPQRKNLLAVFKSGFVLEYLFQQKKFTYELLVFSKPSIP